MVQCKSCGYIGVRARFTGLTYEADDRVRKQGVQFVASEPPCAARVFCYANEREFDAPKVGGEADVLKAIGLELECPSFTKWQRGKTPKEHADMALLDQVQQINRDDKREAERLADKRHAATARIAWIALAFSVVFGIANLVIAITAKR
jgi:hypothetical protein